MADLSSNLQLPPLPSYTLTPRRTLIPQIPDGILMISVPLVAYWTVSLIFHWIDENDYFPQYRLHTPAEVLKRNRVTRWDVVKDVIVQQLIQATLAFGLWYFDPIEYVGKENYDISVWARRIRLLERSLPTILSLFGLNATAVAGKLSMYPQLAGALSGGRYPSVTQTITDRATGKILVAPAFAQWEWATANLIYWYLLPAVQFLFAIFFVDTWQYFLHRAMHMNKYLYTKFHSRHHRLYVPYAFGALYNHPFEGFLLDTSGTGLASIITRMTTRQSTWFFTMATIKTVDDHCGYGFPFDPIQHITSNNAPYHDIHHQSWGIKSNFSQPFFTIWDRVLNTQWTGGDISARYERSRVAAEKQLEQDTETEQLSMNVDGSTEKSGPSNLLQRSVRQKASISCQADGLKGMGHRINGSIRQK